MTPEERKKYEEERKELKQPRTILQKFLFLVITSLQAFIVYMVSREMTYGMSALRANGSIRMDFALLIYGSFALSTVSFLSTCIVDKKWEIYSTLVLGVDAANAAVQTALVNALATPDWGATGDLITVLKYTVQFQVFIMYVNVGFTFVFTQPHIEIPNVLDAIFKLFDRIDDFFISLIKPIMDLAGFLAYIICAPFIAIWNLFFIVVFWILSPFEYIIAFFVVTVGTSYHNMYFYRQLYFKDIFTHSSHSRRVFLLCRSGGSWGCHCGA
jgi:hypothetical protein